jgi:hypothetical protein
MPNARRPDDSACTQTAMDALRCDDAKSRRAMTFIIGALQHFPTRAEAARDASIRDVKRAYTLPPERPMLDQRSATP